MGITLLTAIEVFSNPKDLSFTASEQGIGIFRGEGHNYKPLLTGEKAFKDRVEAAGVIGEILRAIVKAGEKAYTNSKSPVQAILNPKEESLEGAFVLTEELIQKIVRGLEETGEVNTVSLSE